MHQRKAIRQAVVAQLVGRTAAATRVLATRTEPWRPTELPAISVYTPSEQTEEGSKTNRPRELWRDLELQIVGWVTHSQANPAVDALDDLAEQIEAAMNLDPYLAGTCGLTGHALSSTEIAIQDDEDRRADPLVGVVRMVYTVPYTFAAAATPGLADYLRTGATTQIAGDDNTVSDLFDQQAP